MSLRATEFEARVWRVARERLAKRPKLLADYSRRRWGRWWEMFGLLLAGVALPVPVFSVAIQAARGVQFAGGQVITPKATRSFEAVVALAYANRIQLWSDGFYRTPKIHYDKATLTGRPFFYFAYGAACTEVAIDTLTGESRVLAVDILHDVGRSINPAIDIGQIEGGFVQGMGWLTTEQLVWSDTGHLSTHAPSTYKIPTAGDVPEHFKVDLWPEPNTEDNVFGSKAVGEPPFMLAISVFEALRDAVAQARGDGAVVRLTAPATAENVLLALGG